MGRRNKEGIYERSAKSKRKKGRVRGKKNIHEEERTRLT